MVETLPRVLRLLLPNPDSDPLGSLPIGQLRLVRALETGPRIANEVGEELGLSPSALSQMVARLIEAGFVQRTGCQQDKRHRELRLTERGAELLRTHMVLRIGRAENLLQRLSPADRASFLESLEKLAG